MHVFEILPIPALYDESHLDEGYSYDQSSFRSWFVEGVNGDDFCINYINRKEKKKCIKQLKQKTVEANELFVTWYICEPNLSGHRSDFPLQVLISEAHYFPLQSCCQ